MDSASQGDEGVLPVQETVNAVGRGSPLPSNIPPSPPASPERVATFSDRAAKLILKACRAQDTGSEVACVLRDGDGHTIVRVRPSPGHERDSASSLAAAMQRLWPMAQTFIRENALDGSVEAEITIPTSIEEREIAMEEARKETIVRALSAMSCVAFVIAVLLWVFSSGTSGSADSSGYSTANDREL